MGKITIAPGETLRATVYWRNTGTQEHSFDIWVGVGIYDETNNSFTVHYLGHVDNISAPANQTQDNITDVDMNLSLIHI